MTRRLDLKIVGPYGVALAVSAFFYFHAFQIAPAPDNQLGPAVWPKTILLLAMLTCVWEIGRSLSRSAKKPGAATADDDADASPASSAETAYGSGAIKSYTPWVGIALTIGYVAAFPWLGYPLSTLLFVVTFVFFGNYRRPVAAVCVGLVASFAFMFLFMRVVYVSLPMGVEPFARISVLLMHAMGVR